MTISRRAFHRSASGLAAAFAAGSPAFAVQQRPAAALIDVHTHLGQTWNTTEALTAEALLRWMDAHQIAQAIVLPLVSPESSPGLPGLAKALGATPELPFIAHGPGWWASISGGVTQADLGGYPRGEVSEGGAIDALMDAFPNLYGDLSAGSGANAIRRDLKFGREFLIRRADRLMFGTDFLSPGQDVPQFALFEELNLPKLPPRTYRRQINGQP